MSTNNKEEISQKKGWKGLPKLVKGSLIATILIVPIFGFADYMNSRPAPPPPPPITQQQGLQNSALQLCISEYSGYHHAVASITPRQDSSDKYEVVCGWDQTATVNGIDIHSTFVDHHDKWTLVYPQPYKPE